MEMGFLRKLFDEMPSRDVFNWNLSLSGYVRIRNMELVIEFFGAMPQNFRLKYGFKSKSKLLNHTAKAILH